MCQKIYSLNVLKKIKIKIKTWTKILADLKGFTMHNRIQNFTVK